MVFVEDVVDGGVAVLGRRGVDDGLEHAPAFVLPLLIAGYAVHVPYRLDGFGSVVSLEEEMGEGEGFYLRMYFRDLMVANPGGRFSI
jgi:hypothetical protein